MCITINAQQVGLDGRTAMKNDQNIRVSSETPE